VHRRVDPDEILDFLDRIGEWSAAERLREKLYPGAAERDEREFERMGYGDFAASLRARREDLASHYLPPLARQPYSPTDLEPALRALEEEARELDRTRVAENTYEWRIMTVGTERLEKLEDARFRVRGDLNGFFSADFATYVQAREARQVFGQLQKDLFSAVGWASDPWRPRSEGAAEKHPYLSRLSEQARATARPFGDDVERWSGPADVDGVTVERRLARVRRVYVDEPEVDYDVSASSDSLELSVSACTPERAFEFLETYSRLIGDLRRVLGWRWL